MRRPSLWPAQDGFFIGALSTGRKGGRDADTNSFPAFPAGGPNVYDARDLAHALTALGYYTPDPQTGIVPFDPDHKFFDAIRKFQADHELFPSASIHPGDETERALNAALERLKTDGHFYLWRTVGDDKVRGAHVMRNHRLFRWSEDLPGGHPGEDYNCRCWAEPYMRTYAPAPPPLPARKPLSDRQKALLEIAQDRIKRFEKKGYELSKRFLVHYLDKSGTPIRLTSQEMDMFKKNMLKNQKRFEESMVSDTVEGLPQDFMKKMLTMKNGETTIFNSTWDSAIKTDWLKLKFFPDDEQYSIGSVQIKSSGSFFVTRKGHLIEIEGTVKNIITDTYDFNDQFPDNLFIKEFREMAEKDLAKPFKIIGTKIQTTKATLEIKEGKIIAKINAWKWEDYNE